MNTVKNPPLRVHICPVGYDLERVVEPIIRMKADKAYLVTYDQSDNATSFIKQIKTSLKEYKHIKIEDSYIDIWDVYQCMGQFHNIIEREKGNHIFINLSTGTKIASIAGMLSCMLWKAEPYYVKIEYPIIDKPIGPQIVSEIQSLPTYSINKPSQKYLNVLKIIKKNSGRMRKSKIISELADLGIIKQQEDHEGHFSEPAKHSQLRTILDPMENEWNYVSITNRGKKSEVSITEQGENALKIFASSEST